MPSLPVAIVPGHVDVQTVDELRANVLGVTVEGVIQGLTAAPEKASELVEPEPGEVVFEGTADEINRFYYENGWSDGLPIVPPTAARVDEFLRHTDRDADEELGVLLPDRRSATVRTVAINGVMAGCRPEYMPVLVALIEAMADPRYGVEHSGNTPGAETLIIVNGPIIRRLGFNYQQGALRDGFQANTSIGRFWRLYLRNVAGFLPAQDRQGHLRQHLARRAGRERGRAGPHGLDHDRPGPGAGSRATAPSPSRGSPAAPCSPRSSAPGPSR